MIVDLYKILSDREKKNTEVGNTNWIDVAEKLPEVYIPVLAWSTLDDEIVLAHLGYKNNWYCQGLYGCDYCTRSGISHWAELSKGPAE